MSPEVAPVQPRAAQRLAARVEELRRTNPRRAWRVLQRRFRPAISGASYAGRGELWRLRGHLLRSMRRVAEAARAYQRAERWFERAVEPREQGRCTIGLVDALMYAGEYGGALAAARRGRRHLARAGDRAALARLLNNEANLFHRLDRPDLALARYAHARDALRRTRDGAGAARVDINIANCLSLLARTREARSLYRSSRSTLLRAGLAVPALHAAYNLAYLDFLEHHHERALESLSAVRGEAARIGVPALSAVARLDIAEILLHLGAHDEALGEALGAAEECGRLGLAYERGKAETFAALAEFRLGRIGAARRRLEAILPTFHEEGNHVWTGEVLVAIATAWWAGGDASAARGLLLAAARHFAQAKDREREGCARVLAARARVEGGHLAAADRELRMVRAKHGHGGSPRFRNLLLGVEAELARRRGETAAARSSLREAARASERLAARILDEQWRASFWGEWGWPHVEWAALELDEGRLDAALEALERGRGRALGGAIRPGANRTAGSQQSIRAWAAARRARERDRSTRSGERAMSDVRASFAAVPPRLRRDLAGGLPQPITAAQLRDALEPDTLLINYMRHRGRIDAILVTRGACSVVRSLVSDETLQRLVHGMLFELRGAASSGAPHKAADVASLTELAAFVLWPALDTEFGERPPKRLVVVPSGLLARIPWPAMPLPDGRPLCEASDITVVPGLRLGMAPPRARRGGGAPLIVASDVEGLEHAQAEAQEIARLIPDARLLLGSEATAERFLQLAPTAPWIHFAGHGRYQADEPFHSGLRLHDRWIVAEELATTRLSAKWISLSACQTARALIRPGEEWFGLPRTLLQAGAGAVIAPQWDIEDASAARLMRLFYDRLRSGATIARSLASAQAERCKAGDHAIDWAGFVMLSGLGAGRIVPFPSGRTDTTRPTPSGGLS